jgi:hypothetical protein
MDQKKYELLLRALNTPKSHWPFFTSLLYQKGPVVGARPRKELLSIGEKTTSAEILSHPIITTSSEGMFCRARNTSPLTFPIGSFS